MELTDLLTPRDRETIEYYIYRYAGSAHVECGPLPQVLKYWNKNKKTLYRALGKQLRVKIPVNIPKNAMFFQQELKTLYDVYPVWDDIDSRTFLGHLEEMQQRIHNDFVYEFTKFIAEQNWPNMDKYTSSRLVLHQNIEKGYISTVKAAQGEYHFQSFKSTVKNNMRTIKTIQKVLKGMNFPRMDLFEQWRNQVSDLNLNNDIKANLVLSIHPIDFMTMSDNKCGWSSCMSWIGQGGYSSGTIEMMNSNLAIVAYLEHPTPFTIQNEDKTYTIPNKTWRDLIFVNKNIILAGKPYPYFNEDLTKTCLDFVRGLVSRNLGWTYKYINQEYRDCQNIQNNFFLKWNNLSHFSQSDYKHRKRGKQKKAIYVYTNSMYNDIIEYKDTYWCCRNPVKKTIKLCLSGPVTCMCCGEYIEQPQHIESYSMIGSEKICGKCEWEKRCDVCGGIFYHKDLCSLSRVHGHTYVCKDTCLSEMIYLPGSDTYMTKDMLQDWGKGLILGVVKEEVSLSQAFNKIDKAITLASAKTNQDIREIIQEQLNPVDMYMIIPVHSYQILHLGCFDIDHRYGVITEGVLSKQRLEDMTRWIPAKERLNEISSAVSN